MLEPARHLPHARDRGKHLTEFREFQDGEVIEGTRYRVLGLIGVGGMGSVYEVEHTELGKRFVLKALLRELSRRDDLVQRLRNEWRALARLQHGNIVTVTDAGTSGNGVPFYVMERVDGETLAALLRHKRRLHVLEAVHIAASVLEALSAAHDIGIIHRDVKPANVFVVSGGGVKLLDFGIAKMADATGVVTARGLAVGTPRYMSPEQARGERVDGRSDIYASALMLYEMIAGVGPFDDVHEANDVLLAHLAREAPPLSSFVSGVSPELERILSRMLAKDCRLRPAHAREAATQLRNFGRLQPPVVATELPTARAGYAAETVSAEPQRERPVSPIHDALTRPEGAARARQFQVASSPTEDALTRPSAPAFDPTQVTPSAGTSESFSVSSVPNTTYVSPPSFDGSTTLRMSTVPNSNSPPAKSSAFPAPDPAHVERPERTEMLGDLPVPMPYELPNTRTLVPVVEKPRPVSITPPPVVDTGRADGSAPARGARVGRWAGLAAAGLVLALVTGFVLRRAAIPSEGERRSVTVNAVSPAKAPKAVELAPTPAPLAVPKTPSIPALAASGAPSAVTSAAPAASVSASASARNSLPILEMKSFKAHAQAMRSAAAASSSGPSARTITGRPTPVTLPGSGL